MGNVATFNEFVGLVEQRMLEIGCDRDYEMHPIMPWLTWGDESFHFDAIRARREGMREQVNEVVARICEGYDD